MPVANAKAYVVNYGSTAKPDQGTTAEQQEKKKSLLNVPVVDGGPKVHPVYWHKVTYDPLTDPHGQVPGDHQLDECSDPAYTDQTSCEGVGETWTARVPEYFVIPVFDVPAGGCFLCITYLSC